MIDALPAIVAAHPKAQYVILGATHPDVLRDQGEAYRTSLAARAAKLRVTKHVRFVDEFVGRNVLTRWLQAATVFVTPTPDLDTMLSGPLSYAMATAARSCPRPTPTRRSSWAKIAASWLPRWPRPSPPGSIASRRPRRPDRDGRAGPRSRPADGLGAGRKAYEEMLARVASGDSIVAGVATADRSPRPVEAAWRR